MFLNLSNNCLKFVLICLLISNKVNSQINFDKAYDGKQYISAILEINNKYIITYKYGANDDIPYMLLDSNGNIYNNNSVPNEKGIDFLESGKIINNKMLFFGRSYTPDPLDSSNLNIAGYYFSLDNNFNIIEKNIILPDSTRINNFWDIIEDVNGIKYVATRNAFKKEKIAYNRFEILNKDGILNCINIDKRYKNNATSKICFLGNEKILIGLPIDSIIDANSGNFHQKYCLAVYDKQCNFLFEKRFENPTFTLGASANVNDLEKLSDNSILMCGRQKIIKMDTFLHVIWENNLLGATKMIELLPNQQIIINAYNKIISYSKDGNLLWEKDFRNNYFGSDYEIQDIIATSDGGFAFAINENSNLRIVKIACNSELIYNNCTPINPTISLTSNVVTDKIEIKFNQLFNGYIIISNTIGQIILQKKIISSYNESINTNVLPSGVYLITFKKDQNKKQTIKFIKK